MAYRRYPAEFRRSPAHNQAEGPADAQSSDSIRLKDLNEIVSIPPPNQFESVSARDFTPKRGGKNPIMDFFKDRIRADEIILIALIFLLLEEGVEDEFLLIMLIYILLVGREI